MCLINEKLTDYYSLLTYYKKLFKAVSSLSYTPITIYVSLKDMPWSPPIKEPILPKPLNLKQDFRELDDEFKARVKKVKKYWKKEILAIKDAYKKTNYKV